VIVPTLRIVSAGSTSPSSEFALEHCASIAALISCAACCASLRDAIAELDGLALD
jgi:hypothetical protein